MRPKSLVLLALALGCGLVASIGISQVMERRGDNSQAALETEAVFVAKKDIKENEALTEQLLELEQWPKAKIPAGALAKREDWENQRLKVQLFKGEPLLKGKLADPNAWIGKKIPPGYVALPVQVDVVSVAGGLIKPKDRVNVLVYLTRNSANDVGQTSVQTILQNVEVFAVDNQYRRPDNPDDAPIAKVVSLLVTPPQGEKVTLASEMGKLRLVLRNPDDDTLAEGVGAVTQDLKGTEAGDRNTENDNADPKKTATNSSKAASFLDLLRGGKNAPATTTVSEGPTTSQRELWTMTIIESDKLREVEFDMVNGKPLSRGGAKPADIVPTLPNS